MRLTRVALALLVVACSDSTGPRGNEVASILMSPWPNSVCLGCDNRIFAVALDARGLPLLDQPVSFATSDPSIVSVNSAERVLHGVALGKAMLTVTAGSVVVNVETTVSEYVDPGCVPYGADDHSCDEVP